MLHRVPGAQRRQIGLLRGDENPLEHCFLSRPELGPGTVFE
jgi:hypothetical protein